VVGSNATLSSAENINYSEKKKYDLFAGFAGYSVRLNRSHFSLNVREDIVGETNHAFTFNSSASRMFWDLFTARISGGRSFRAPSMNDLYWVPGGNPSLQPERGWFSEAGMNFKRTIGINEVEINTTAYTNYIDNWIIWLPQTQTIWTPRNIKNVLSKGVEVFIKDKFRIGQLTTSLQASYSYTEATNESSEEADIILHDQLIYIPYYLANASIDLDFKNFGFRFNSAFTGGRYVRSDHTAALPYFNLLNSRLTYQFTVRKQRADLFFEIKNITNKRYQVLENRPMPGRTFETGITINLNK
jgi:iron complex outermembrane receptor protein